MVVVGGEVWGGRRRHREREREGGGGAGGERYRYREREGERERERLGGGGEADTIPSVALVLCGNQCSVGLPWFRNCTWLLVHAL